MAQPRPDQSPCLDLPAAAFTDLSAEASAKGELIRDGIKANELK